MRWIWSLLLCCTSFCSYAQQVISTDIEPIGRGPYLVESTNMEVSSEYSKIGDQAMHEYLLGLPDESGDRRYITDILKNPEAAWITDVPVPDESSLYGPASGQTLPVVTFLTYPSNPEQTQRSYAFPYHAARYGVFEDMLNAGEAPSFADPEERYPLIIIAHGFKAHGIYDVQHAQSLASHGYIVAVIFYGDDRTVDPQSKNHHLGFLRPLLTKAVLDSLLDSDTFGAHIDPDNIGITGHSYGGFTALALAGGPYLGNALTVSDKRIKAGSLAAPWVGDNRDGSDFFAFGTNNSGLNKIITPMISFFGTSDQASLASFVLPAVEQFSGPSFVVELVDQPHIFEQGSWQDRDSWELLFFSAYLKNNPQSLAQLKVGRSMKEGNLDFQLFDYQKLGAPKHDQ